MKAEGPRWVARSPLAAKVGVLGTRDWRGWTFSGSRIDQVAVTHKSLVVAVTVRVLFVSAHASACAEGRFSPRLPVILHT